MVEFDYRRPFFKYLHWSDGGHDGIGGDGDGDVQRIASLGRVLCRRETTEDPKSFSVLMVR